MYPNKFVNIILIFLLVSSFIVSIGTGAYHLPFWEIPKILINKLDGFEILFYIRIPRTIIGLLAGASLAVSGAALQALFRNPLADPGLIGITTGTGFGISLWIVFGGLLISNRISFVFIGFFSGLFVTYMIWRIAFYENKTIIYILLLSGIALNSIFGAGIGFITFLANDEELRDITFWLLGSIAGITWKMILITLPFIILGLIIIFRRHRELDIFSLGESEAYHLGISVQNLKREIFIGTSLCIGASVSIVGGIGFIGLVVPHFLRLLGGSNNKYLIISSALCGGLVLMLSDTIARTLFSPIEIPVGVITAFLGGPFFLWLILKSKKEIS